jgi:hypothetical protein
MKATKSFILICILALMAIMVAGIGFASNNTTLEEHDFDSYFKMGVPKGVSFEKTEGIPSKNINLTVNYRNDAENISIVYTESQGAKDDLLKYYEDFARNDENITLNTINNTTVIHFKDENIIGEINYHDLAIAGDNDKYIIMQCDNETLMKSMAESLKFS